MEHKKEGQGLWFVLAVFALSRVFYLVAGRWLAERVPVGRFQKFTSDVPFGTLNIWAHFDGEHYTHLALYGYLHPPYNVSPAFFPLYPLLVRSFAELFGGPISADALGVWGVIVSLVALPFALWFVYRIAEDGWGTRTARGTVLTLAFFPTTLFLNAVYTESLFLAISAGAIWAVRVRKNLLLACLLAGLASATRLDGIFLGLPLACEWFREARRYRWQALYLILAPSGLALYAAYLWWRFGKPQLFFTDQKNWGRRPVGPVTAFRETWEKAGAGASQLLTPQLRHNPTPAGIANHLAGATNAYNLAFLIFAVIILIAGLRLLPLGLSAYAFLLVVPPVFLGTEDIPLMGMPRYVLVAFPLFITLGRLLKNRWLLSGWLILSTAFSLVLCAMFVSWRFIA